METDPHKTVRSVRTVTLIVFISFVVVAVVCLTAAARIASKRVNLQTRDSFEAAMGGADGVRLTIPYGGKVVFESNDVNVIRELCDNIKLARYGADLYCNCGGDVKFEFYKEGRPAIEFTFHHQYKIRWQGFHKDIKLTKESRKFLVGWLSRNIKDEELREQFERPYKEHNSK